MSGFSLENRWLYKLAREHQAWLAKFDPRHARKWAHACKNDPESAFCEAEVRRRLQRNGATVEPGERLTQNPGGPDFRCAVGRDHFYVEATCIKTQNAEGRTGACGPTRTLRPYNAWGLNEQIFNEVKPKAKQCRNLDGPALVAVGTWATAPGMLCFERLILDGLLIGKLMLSWDIDSCGIANAGEAYNYTEFECATFLSGIGAGILTPKRRSISGIIVCNLGVSGQQMLGVLHPDPVRRFSPELLPGVDFGTLAAGRTTGQVRVNWSKTNDDD